MNAYLLTFGGFLLLGGRLGDLYGHRRLFLIGIALFTLASLACGLSTSQQAAARRARAVQGLGGAIVSAVALSLIMKLFTEPAERAKAMGVFGFVAAGGGTHRRAARRRAHRRARLALDLPRQPADRHRGRRRSASRCCRPAAAEGAGARLDVAGAVTVTAALMLAVYAIVNGNEAGWTSAQTLGLLGASAALLGGVPRHRVARRSRRSCRCGLFRLRNVATANVVGVLWAAAMFAWFFLSALYLQLVLGYSPLQVGLAFLPANLIMGAFSLGLSAQARDALRHPRRRSAVGLLAGRGRAGAVRARAGRRQLRRRRAARACSCSASAPASAFNPVLLAAMSDVAPEESGLASGVVNTVVHDGRRARPGGPREPRRVAHRHACGPRATARSRR